MTAPTYYLEMILPSGATSFALLPPDASVIGRSEQRAVIVVPDARVSRIHLRVFRSVDYGVTVTDMFTANGTQLDGRDIPAGTPITWLVDQTITIGGTRLILRYGPFEAA